MNAVIKLGYQPKVSGSTGDITNAKAVILPGVGAGGDVMTSLQKAGLIEAIRSYIAADRPFFGICIGLQVLFTHTDEGGGYDCLNVIPGRVKRLPGGQKIPHMGWNQVRQRQHHLLFRGIPDETNFYFVHSYYGEPADKNIIIGETEYGIAFCSALAKGNLVATQFHPEKSGDPGLLIYKNFLDVAKC